MDTSAHLALPRVIPGAYWSQTNPRDTGFVPLAARENLLK